MEPTPAEQEMIAKQAAAYRQYQADLTKNEVLRAKAIADDINTVAGFDSNYINDELSSFNPTSKTSDQDNSFSIGFKIGNFALGYSNGQLPQFGERVDYTAFLLQAGKILRTNRFMATLFFPWSNSKLTRSLSYACEEVQMNDQKIEAMPYRMNMEPGIMAPYHRDFGGTVTLTFRMFVDDLSEYNKSSGLTLFGVNLSAPKKDKAKPGTYPIEPRKSLLRWQNEIVNFDGKWTGVNYFDNYTKNTSIIISFLDTSSNVLKNIEFVQVYPLEIGGLNPSWEGQHMYVKQTVTFAFTRIIDSAYGNGFIPAEAIEEITMAKYNSMPDPNINKYMPKIDTGHLPSSMTPPGPNEFIF
jgi:hypothetical protein